MRLNMNKLFEKLPFRKMAEKIPTGTREKIPVLNKAIPFANHIACGLVAVLLVVGILACGGGGGANSPKDFSWALTEDGKGIIIKGYTGKPGKIVVPSKIEGVPIVEIASSAFDGKTYTITGGFSDYNPFGSEENKNVGITSITIPDTVKKIGSYAFANTSITRFIMPDSVTELSVSFGTNDIFHNCLLLSEVRLSDNLETLTYFGSLPVLQKINLPKNLKEMDRNTFMKYGELNVLTIPDTVKSIEFGVWGGSSGLYPKPYRIYKIGEINPVTSSKVSEEYVHKAFEGCNKLPLKTRQKLQELGYKGKF
jgi:hypothetical protein